MKRRSFKSKIYELIGRAVVGMTAYVGVVGFIVWSFTQNLVY